MSEELSHDVEAFGPPVEPGFVQTSTATYIGLSLWEPMKIPTSEDWHLAAQGGGFECLSQAVLTDEGDGVDFNGQAPDGTVLVEITVNASDVYVRYDGTMPVGSAGHLWLVGETRRVPLSTTACDRLRANGGGCELYCTFWGRES